jgi:hypothetical protein
LKISNQTDKTDKRNDGKVRNASDWLADSELTGGNGHKQARNESTWLEELLTTTGRIRMSTESKYH